MLESVRLHAGPEGGKYSGLPGCTKWPVNAPCPSLEEHLVDVQIRALGLTGFPSRPQMSGDSTVAPNDNSSDEHSRAPKLDTNTRKEQERCQRDNPSRSLPRLNEKHNYYILPSHTHTETHPDIPVALSLSLGKVGRDTVRESRGGANPQCSRCGSGARPCAVDSARTQLPTVENGHFVGGIQRGRGRMDRCFL